MLKSTLVAKPKNAESRLYRRDSVDDPFLAPQLLGEPLDALGSIQPVLSADGRRLYFHSRELPEGQGELDLWYVEKAPRSEKGK